MSTSEVTVLLLLSVDDRFHLLVDERVKRVELTRHETLRLQIQADQAPLVLHCRNRPAHPGIQDAPLVRLVFAQLLRFIACVEFFGKQVVALATALAPRLVPVIAVLDSFLDLVRSVLLRSKIIR